ncbi:MAG: glycosyltransferase family 2 protein [Candidatus Omnitrophica bacterium]|nr:glycosyltransferase family 2 protein [Candidatus Omnitrophota bacterium]
MNIAGFIYTIFLLSLAYFLILTLYYIFLALVGSMEELRKMIQGEDEDYSLLYFSPLQMAVTFVVPARNEEEWIADSLKSIINIDYPTFEVVVVNDGSTDKTMDILNGLLKLTPIDMMYAKHYSDGRVRGVLKSEKYPNITVVDKDAGNKKAGAVNAGLNLARTEYVCIIDADTILERDSLKKVMAQIAKEPDKIIGAGSYFGLVNGFKIKDGTIMEHSFSYNPLVAYQNIEYMRSFIGNRLAWSRYNAMPNVAGGFGIWRKDILYELGGYSKEFTCEDIELTFRAHDYVTKNKEKGYKIIMLPYNVGWTEGPSTIPALISQRNRWQRVTNETIWHYKYMALNPKFGFFGFLTMPYFILYECLGVFIEVISVSLVAAGWIMGVLNLNVFIAFFLFMLLSQSFVSLLSILTIVEHRKIFKLRYVMYMTMLALTEFFFYRWLISVAKILGTIDFFLSKKQYDQYERPKRA